MNPDDRGMTVGTLAGLALGLVGFGFGAFMYVVPYRHAARELKLREGQMMADETEVTVQRRELDQIKQDLAQTRGASNLAESTWRSDFKLIAATMAEHTRGMDVKVTLTARHLMVTFGEDALFDGRGPWFSKTGQQALETLAVAVAGKAGRVLVTAPMGAAHPPRWVADQFATPGELSAARVRNVVKVFTKAGAPVATVWGVTSGGPSGAESATPTLDVEIDPAEGA